MVVNGGSLTLTATPNTSYAVNTWSVDGTIAQTGGTTFTISDITANHVVQVTFLLLTFTITPTAGTNGWISPSTPQTVNYGGNLTLTALPHTNYAVSNWSVDGTQVQTGGTTFTLTNILAGHTVQVSFTTAGNADCTITPQAGLGGSISPSSITYVQYGSSLTFAAIPQTNYTVDHWSLDSTTVQVSGIQYTLQNITNTHTVRVSFKYIGANEQGDWWLFHHDTRHTGCSSFTGPSTPAQQWVFGTSLYIYSSPALAADGTIYVGSGNGFLYAINPDGTEKWAYLTESSIMNSSPAVAPDGTVYVGTWMNSLFAINPDGTFKWAFPTEDAVYSSPTIAADGTVYFTAGNIGLYAVNPDGTLKWAFYVGGNHGSSYSSPAFAADGTIYIGSEDNNLYAINPDGTERWAFTTGDMINSSPAVGTDGTIYVGSDDNRLYAINPDGTQKWAFLAQSCFTTSPAIGKDGTIYAGASDRNLYAINSDGSQKWAFATHDMIFSSPAIGADGTTYVGSNDGSLYAVNQDGTEQWAFQTGNYIHSSPAIGGGGTIYVGSDNGDLYAINAPNTNTTFTVTALAGTNGTLTPGTPQTVKYGSSLTLTATPNNGYAVQNWAVDGTVVQTGGTTFTLTNISANHTVQVAFIKTYSITPVAGANGTVAPNTVQTVNRGSNLPFTATPNSGYTVLNWSVDGTVVQTGGTTFTLQDITGNHSVQVAFVQVFIITPSPGANGTIIPNSASAVTAGSSLTFTATPGTGYTVNTWAVDGTVVQTGGTVFTLAMITANHGVQVSFNPLAVSAVALTALPLSPQYTGSTITLTATPTVNGGQVQYLFRAGYTDTAGWHWTNLTAGYITTASCTWTPAVAHTYTLVVWARAVGHAANYDAYCTMTYQVNLALLNAVALSAKPAAPQPFNTPITLTATPTGASGPVEYLFRVGYMDAAGWHWRISMPCIRPPPPAPGRRCRRARLRW